ncbi:protein LONGIFOLIA 1-like [Salvia miltiorrhiza]|uniref:protein LONGIFOLIA 1-like n=1 Tax=Salvia miltiorrhiza TaxID=226208 RepID=UPI0025AC2BFF|nr:protein LONGIFOLIA 1-like [Salvia miltiorrhiza]
MVKTSDGNEDVLPRQIGCINGIFQLFNHRLFFVGRSFGSHPRKRLLIGSQQQLEPRNATKAVIAKDPDLQKGRTRESSESPEASSPSSSHSSTHSSMTGQKHLLNRGLESSDIRGLVKDSMYREARGMKHVDSPRPLQRSKGAKDILPRFSYDGTGRETHDAVKTNTKLKENPRFSLDSKASSLIHSALESRLNSLCCKVPPVTKESGSHSRSSSIVTKLMGLDDFPNSIITDESSTASPKVAFLSKPPTAAERRQLKQVSFSQSVSRKNPATQSPQHRRAISAVKTNARSKLPLESAPWRHQDCSKKQSQKMARQSGKAPADGSFPSSSVYGQIEKRITELEFKRSGKDLRALKQILEAMQKTREKVENQRQKSDELKLQESALEDSCSDQNSSSLMLQNRKTFQQQPALTTKETFRPKQLTSSTGTTKLTGKVKISSSRSHDSKYDRENQASRERAHHRTSMNNNVIDPNQRFPCIDKKITSRNVESEHSAPQRERAENCTTSGRGSQMVSPRLQYIVLKPERGSRPNTSTSESESARTQLSKRVREKCCEKGKHRVKSMDLSSLSSETRYSSYHGDTASSKSESNNSVASQAETDAVSSVNLFSLNSREHQDYVTTPKEDMPAVITMEQPSPVSVLDTPFYTEGSPSPVKKISTAFQDECPSPDEAEWNLQNLNHLAASTKSDSSYRNNQQSENLFDLIHESGLLKTKPKGSAANGNEYAYQSTNPEERYINKMPPELGLFKDTSIIQMDSHLLFLGFNSNTFHALQEEDDTLEYSNDELCENTDKMKKNQKIQRKIVADVANEILVRKITSGRLSTTSRRMSLQRLMKEVYLEMEQLCRMPHCNVDDEDDESIRALHVDMKYQSDDWICYSGDIPALVLDIERLIFKDLVNEVIHM